MKARTWDDVPTWVDPEAEAFRRQRIRYQLKSALPAALLLGGAAIAGLVGFWLEYGF